MQDNCRILSYSCRQLRPRFSEKFAFYRSEVWKQVRSSVTALQISVDPVLGGLQASSKEFVDDGVLAESLNCQAANVDEGKRRETGRVLYANTRSRIAGSGRNDRALMYSGQGPHDSRARADVARRQAGGDRGLRLSHETV
jgi:hypothetical protein